MVTDPRTRLVELSAAQRVSLAQLSAMIGRNSTYLQQFVRKGSPRKLEEGDRHRLAQFFGVDEAELGRAEDLSPASAPHKGSGEEWAPVRRLALGASAGPGSLAEADEAIGTLGFSPQWLRQQGLDPKKLTVIAVEGDSMEPTLRDGDEILVDEIPRRLRSGIYVARLDGALVVKRLEPAGERVRLISDNKVYAPIDRPLGDVEVLGRVVWKGGRL